MSSLQPFSAEAAAQRQELRRQILDVSPATFDALSLAIFRYQAAYNPIYRAYLHHLGTQPERVTSLHQVPFMPIGFFKHHPVRTDPILTGFADSSITPETLTFASSGTTGTDRTSHHYVPDAALYDAVSTRIFEQQYGPLRDFHILALLPSYLERNNSSLVYMVQRFMEQANSPRSGFFLNDHDELTAQLRQLTSQSDRKRTLLIGVTFALLDWAESGRDLRFLANAPNLIVMETGGMKGRRKELLREEVHTILTDQLGVDTVHSEYGMTELLSQAYSAGNGVFRPSPTLRVLLRDINDPFHMYQPGDTPAETRQTGGINVIDLANLDSCSFIETQDLGQYVKSGNASETGLFRVIGRFDNSDVRGCNLLIE